MTAGTTEPRRVVVATGNPHKLDEIAAILSATDAHGPVLELISMRDLDVPEPVEDGTTFEANALIKARACAAASGLPALADDSGLEVDALQGAPGVYSARYAGEPSDDARNNARLVRELSGIPASQRTARFVCAAAIVVPGVGERVVRGTMEGRVIDAPRGTQGFGYDPHFVSDAVDDGRTNAELAPDEKHALSHRGAAFRALREELPRLLPADG